MTGERAGVFPADRRDELVGELHEYDPEMALFDGQTAGNGLRLAINAAYVLDQPPRILFDGRQAAEDREAQPPLF